MPKLLEGSFCTGLLILFSLHCFAQEITEVKADYPGITFNVTSSQAFEASDIMIVEDGDSIPTVSMQLVDSTKGKSALCILFESSSVTHGQATNAAINGMIDGISTFIGNSHDVAIGLAYYNRANKNNIALNKLSDGFQNYLSANSIQFVKDEEQYENPWTDMYKAVFESLDWMHQFEDQYQNMTLVVVGTGKAISESPIRENECINRALEFRIPIFTLGVKSNDRYAYDNMRMLSEKTRGIFSEASRAGEIAEALGKISKNEQKQIFNYQVNYSTLARADGKTRQVSVRIKGVENAFSFTSPSKAIYLQSWFLLLIGLCFIILILVGWWQLKKNKQKKADKKPIQKITADAGQTKFESTIANDYADVSDKNNLTSQSSKSTSAPIGAYTMINVPPKGFVITANGIRSSFTLQQGNTTLGRNPDNDIKISEPSVSGNHALIEFENNKCLITNLSKTNGIVQDGKKISKTMIYAGQSIRLGLVEITFI